MQTRGLFLHLLTHSWWHKINKPMLIQCAIKLNLIHETQVSQGRIYTRSDVLVSCCPVTQVWRQILDKMFISSRHLLISPIHRVNSSSCQVISLSRRVISSCRRVISSYRCAITRLFFNSSYYLSTRHVAFQLFVQRSRALFLEKEGT